MRGNINTMAYKIGIMMIGSLYWDESDVRTNWRASRLTDEQYDTYAPIRYGRRSKNRGCTYTMVFSKLCARKDYGLGSAKVVTCTNIAQSIDDIIEEAKLLWAAERESSKPNNKFWATWGSIGLISNPDSNFPDNYFSKWSDLTASSEDYGNISHTKSETPILGKSGFLKLPWPTNVNNNEPLNHDVILATATNPTLNNGAYPKAKVIAEAWRNDKDNNVKYFWENNKHRINTFQDTSISNMLKINEKNA